MKKLTNGDFTNMCIEYSQASKVNVITMYLKNINIIGQLELCNVYGLNVGDIYSINTLELTLSELKELLVAELKTACIEPVLGTEVKSPEVIDYEVVDRNAGKFLGTVSTSDPLAVEALFRFHHDKYRNRDITWQPKIS